MEKLKNFTAITWMLMAMMACELIFLVWQVKPQSNVLWFTIGLVAVTFLWLLRIALTVIKELKNKHKR